MASQTIEIIPHAPIKADVQDILSAESFEAHCAQFKHLPWLQEIKRNAWDSFNALPMPKRTDEPWRFSKIGERFSFDAEYHLSQAPSEYEQVDIVKHSNIVSEYAGALVFEDNHLLNHDFISDDLAAQGVIWEPLLEAFEKHPELMKQYFAKLKPELGAEKFFHLNIAYAHTGSFLYVPEAVCIEKPFMVYNWGHAVGSAMFPQTLIVAEANSQVSLVDVYTSHGDEGCGLAISVGTIFADENAQVFRKTVQNWDESTVSFQLDTTSAARDAMTKTVAVNLGSALARFENKVNVEGTGAECKVYSLTVADENQEFDQRTRQVHKAGSAVSNLLYKNALLDQSRSIFSGLIYVEENAQKTDAYQTNRNLLLNPAAEANSLPGLEIAANDVKCSHGATTGQIDDRELFYMLSRGIPKEKAYELLVFGFFEEVLSQIDNEELSENLRGLIQAKFQNKVT